MPAASRHEISRPASRSTTRASRIRKATQVVEAASAALSGGTTFRRRGQATPYYSKTTSAKSPGLLDDTHNQDTSSLFQVALPTIGPFAHTFDNPHQSFSPNFTRALLQNQVDEMLPDSSNAADSRHTSCPPPFQPLLQHQSAATPYSLPPRSAPPSPKLTTPHLKDVVDFVMRVHRLDPYHLKLVWIYGGNSWSSHSRALSWVERYQEVNDRLPMDVTLKKEGRSKGGVQSVRCTVDNCGRTFSEVQSAAEHIVSKHIGAVKWRCTFPGCQKDYNHSYDLKRHHQTKHGIKMPQRGRRRHDIPMISASDIEVDSLSPFLTSPSTLANSPARSSVLITPQSESALLTFPQSATLEKQLTAENPDQLLGNSFTPDSLSQSASLPTLDPYIGGCLPAGFSSSLFSTFDTTFPAGFGDATPLIGRRGHMLSHCTTCGCARNFQQSALLSQAASPLSLAESVGSPAPNCIVRGQALPTRANLPPTVGVSHQYTFPFPPAYDSEISNDLRSLLSQPSQPDIPWSNALSMPHISTFLEQTSSSSQQFSLNSLGADDFNLSIPQNSDDLSWFD